MSRPDHEMKLLKADWVWIEPAASPVGGERAKRDADDDSQAQRCGGEG